MTKITNLYNSELVSGILLVGSFSAAIFVANIQTLQEIYKSFTFYPITFGYGQFVYTSPLIQIVNDGLMTLFFLLIGLELKFHLACGEFQDKKTLILPGAAAIGGVVMPALVYWVFNFNSPDTLKGWAITIATDTAFMLGILCFFGEFISNKLRAFIIGFSLIDDSIALLILAIFYTTSASFIAIAASVIFTTLLFILNRLKITSSFYYLSIGIFLWVAMVESGIHGTLCGVIVALVIPVEKNGQPNRSFHGLENALRPLVHFGLLPLFVFINSGISFDIFSLDILTSPLALGIILGLFIGKQCGIFLFSYTVVKLNYCSLPQNVSWIKFYGIGVLGGIGFTLSLFIGDLTFESSNPNYVMRISVIIGSLLSAVVGIVILAFSKKKGIATNI
jgi:NhaA family Na+:H+ antiporter